MKFTNENGMSIELTQTEFALIKEASEQVENCTRVVSSFLTNESITWIVNEYGELGVRIANKNLYLYKGESYTCDIFEQEGKPDRPMRWRKVEKREFGEVCYPNVFHTDKVNEMDEAEARAYRSTYNAEFDWQEG